MAASVLHGASQENSTYDLAIEDVALRKISKEGAFDNQYVATLTIENQGDSFLFQQVLLKIAPLNKILVLSKSDGNFSLDNNEKMELEQSFSIPKDIAEQKISFSIEPMTFVDQKNDNDSKAVVLKNDVSGIEDFRITNIDSNDNIGFDWENTSNADIEYTLLVADSDKIISTDDNYREVSNSNYLYSTSSFKHAILSQLSFHDSAMEGKSIQPDWDLWNDTKYRAVVLQAYDAKNETKSFSDILYLQPLKELTRAELARLIVDELHLSTHENVVHFFRDVSDDDWFAPYVKTLYGEGALEDELDFRPNDIATRRDFAAMVSNIFQLPYQNISNFEDVGPEDSDYYSIGSLKKLVDFWSKKNNFLPDSPMLQQAAESILTTLESKTEIN